MDRERKRKRRIALVGLVLASLCVTIAMPVAAQQEGTPQPIDENTTYYPNETGETNTTGWIPGDGNATAPAILEMIARVPGMFIGVGPDDPSGSGRQGFLLTGLVIGAATLFATVGTNVGPVGGSMLGMVLALVLTAPEIALIPVWIRPLLLFTLVGVPASVAILRVFRR